MLNKKGQAITEYGVIMLLALGLGIFIWFRTGITDSINTLFHAIGYQMAVTVGGEETLITYDTTNQYKNSQKDVLKRASPTYKTTLNFNGKTILWRYEGATLVKDSKGNPILDADRNRQYINPKYKAYTFDIGNDSDYFDYGSAGLMINSYGTKLNKNSPVTYVDSKYISPGYTIGEDSNGTYTATYFISDGQIYQIRDYTTATKTVLAKYTGSTDTNVTAYTSTDTTKSTTTTISALAAKRTEMVSDILSGTYKTNIAKNASYYLL